MTLSLPLNYLKQRSFPPEVEEPLAQVTLVFANHGDCNFIDFCYEASKTSTGSRTETWQRSLIDFGPTSSRILNTLRLLSQNLLLPPTSASQNQNVPAVNRVTITHIDEDHIGNANAFLDWAMENTISQLNKLDIAYIDIPILWRRPERINASANYELADPKKSGDVDKVIIEFTVAANQQAQNFIAAASYALFPEWEDDLPKKKSKWSWDTTGESNPWTRRLMIKNPRISMPTSLSFTLSVMFTVGRLEEDGTAEMRDFPKAWKSRMTLEYPVDILVLLDQAINAYDALHPAAKKIKLSARSMESASPAAPPQQPRQMGDVRSLVAAMDVSATIRKASKKSAIAWNVIKPEYDTSPKMWAVWDGTKLVSSERIIGPSRTEYNDLANYIVAQRIQSVQADGDPDFKFSYNADATNRASVVTMFERHQDDNQKATMLFTGDAYEKSCDIRGSLMAWSPPDTWTISVDLLKVPHHGSSATTDAHFYSFCRANVYLICAANSKHGNPRLSTLEAIIKSFGNGDNQSTADKKWRIYFTDPAIAKDSVNEQDKVTQLSAVRRILYNSKLRPNALQNYRMFRLKEFTGQIGAKDVKEVYAPFGSVLLGREAPKAGEKIGKLNVSHDTTQWQEIGAY